MRLDREDIRTFAYLHSAADWAVEQAESSSDRQMYASMHAILSSVHCLEAFANHLGPRYFGDQWDTREAKLATPKEKLRALLGHFHVDLAQVQPQYDSFILGLSIRKELTHGRTHEVIKGSAAQRFEGSTVSTSHPDWKAHCEPKTARRVFDAVTSLVECLGEASGEGRLCWGILGGGSGWQEQQ